MPSPVGHALAGIAAGWIVRGAPASAWSHRWRETAMFAALGVAPDLDLLIGLHSGPTHGLAVAVVAAATAWFPWFDGERGGRRAALAIACVLAYATHTLLDWLGSDTSAPIGIMALWPFSDRYYESNLHVFMAVSRGIHRPELFWSQNLPALARELVILGPVVAAVGLFRRKSSRKIAGQANG